VARHEDHVLIRHLVGNGYGLFRITSVIAYLKLKFLAFNTTFGIDVGDRHLGAAPKLLTKRGVLTGHRACSSDDDIRPSAHGECRQH
jgi:hypothetical protein